MAGSFVVVRQAVASPDEVWALVSDPERWPEFAPVLRAELERRGTDHPHGVGAIRALGPKPFTSREEIVAFEPPSHLAYTMLSGLPVEGYRSDVELEPDGAGTRITWRSSWESARAESVVGPFLHAATSLFATRLARRAAGARRSAA